MNTVSVDAGETADAADVVVDAAPPVDAKSCTANTTTCTNGQVEVCGEAGTVTGVEICALGCAPQGTRCYQVTPSNGLAPYLDQSSAVAPVVLPSGSSVDTDSGEIIDGTGTRIAVVSATVEQAGEDVIRVFMAGAFSLGDIRLTGRNAVAFVATGAIEITGVVDVSGDLGVDGPGSGSCAVGRGGTSMVRGHWERQRAGNPDCPNQEGYTWVSIGGGGGGFGTAGGSVSEGTSLAPGGAAGDPAQQAALVPLRGGCPGAGERGTEGGGGGAVQLVSATAIRLSSVSSPAVLHAGGGGGRGATSACISSTVLGASGGGSGGAVLLEAPVVELKGPLSGIVTSGGAGGSGCMGTGASAEASGTIALAPSCGANEHGSTGGAGANIAPAGDVPSGGNAPLGGGGGGLGRIRINTFDGTYIAGPASYLRGETTTGTIGIR